MIRKLLAAVAAAALVASGGAVAAAGVAHAAAPVVTEIGLTPTFIATNGHGQGTASATLTLHSTGKIVVQDVVVAVRDAVGNNLDFPGAHAATINGDYEYTSGPRTFAGAQYREYGSYKVNNVWHPLPSKTLTVAAPTPPPASPGPTGIPGNWNSAFDDEFNGTALNTRVWQPGWFGTGTTGPVNGAETHPYSSANVTESGGSLNLALTSSAGALVSSNPSAIGNGGGYQLSGPAAIEARVYIPGTGATVDNFPAFWTDGQNWPTNGEIDVTEGLGGSTAYHVHTSASPNGVGRTVNVGSGWHTFGANWSGTTVTFYYDGVNVGSEPYSTANASQYILFDNSSSASVGGPTVPGVMQVDFVRVFTPAP